MRDLRGAFGKEEPTEAGDAHQASMWVWFSFSRRLVWGEIWKPVPLSCLEMWALLHPEVARSAWKSVLKDAPATQ